jgi:hypothetical protein
MPTSIAAFVHASKSPSPLYAAFASATRSQNAAAIAGSRSDDKSGRCAVLFVIGKCRAMSANLRITGL